MSNSQIRRPSAMTQRSRLLLLSILAGSLSLAFIPSFHSVLSSASPFVKPYHHGRVVYSVENDDAGRIVYKREFTVPCGDGLLVFNVGTAPSYAPYFYDVYEDAYAYSDNSGLCLLYPSWQGLQQSYHKLWETSDLTAYTVTLGDTPNKISSRVVRPTGSKDGEAKRGGDYVIMRPHDFYTPAYYQRLKQEVNAWKESEVQTAEDIQSKLEAWVMAQHEEVVKWQTGTNGGLVIAIEEQHRHYQQPYVRSSRLATEDHAMIEQE